MAEAMRGDRVRDAIFLVTDKLVAMLDFILGVVYKALDFWNAGWCDATGIPVASNCSPSPTSQMCGNAGGSAAGGRWVFFRRSSVQVEDCGVEVERNLADMFYRPRRASANASWSDGSETGKRKGCSCWGWHLKQLGMAEEEGQGEGEIQPERLALLLRQIVLDEHKKSGWSECQCEECTSGLMPLDLALDRLHVVVEKKGDECGPGAYNSAGSSTDDSEDEDDDDDGRDMAFSTEGSLDSSSDSDSVPASGPARELMSRSIGDDMRLAWAPSSAASSKPTSAVLFLHGIYSSSTFWFETLIPHLSPEIKSRHQILVPDLLGCGKSPRPVDCLYTLEDQVASIQKSVLERHDVASFHIVSHSMGTLVALALAARFPDRVRSVIMIAPLYGGTDTAQVPACDAIMALTKPWTLKGIKAMAGKDYYNVSRLIAHILFSRHRLWVPIMHRHLKIYPESFIEGYFRNSHHATWHMSHNTLLSGTHAMAHCLARLHENGKQVLVIHGDIDTTCFYAQSVQMSQHFENVRLVTAPGKGHVDVIFGSEKTILQDVEKEILFADAHWPSNSSFTTNREEMLAS